MPYDELLQSVEGPTGSKNAEKTDTEILQEYKRFVQADKEARGGA